MAAPQLFQRRKLAVPILPAITADTALSADVIGTTETAIATVTLPANELKVGTLLHFRYGGHYTKTGVGSPTINARVRYGTSATALASRTVLSTTGTAFVSGATTRTTVEWYVEGWLACRAIGASGTVMPHVRYQTSELTNDPAAYNSAGTALTPETSAITVDTTVANLLTLSMEYSANTAGNSITITNAWCMEIGP